MFGRNRAERRRAQRQADRVLAEARMAADAARKALRDSRSADGGRAPDNEDLADAVQAAILGSILPIMTETGLQGKRERDQHQGSGTLFFLVGLAIGAGVATWARHGDDLEVSPPEDDEWELLNPASTKAVKAAINETLDKADRVVRQAARAAAQTMGAAIETVADAAGPTAEIVSDRIKTARTRATSEVIRTLDDLDDVWGNDPEDTEPSSASSATKKPTARKPTPRKPVVGKPAAAKPKASKAKPASQPRSSDTKK